MGCWVNLPKCASIFHRTLWLLLLSFVPSITQLHVLLVLLVLLCFTIEFWLPNSQDGISYVLQTFFFGPSGVLICTRSTKLVEQNCQCFERDGYLFIRESRVFTYFLIPSNLGNQNWCNRLGYTWTVFLLSIRQWGPVKRLKKCSVSREWGLCI